MALQLQVRRLLVMVGQQPLIPLAEVDGAEVGHQNQAVPAEVQVPVDGLAHHAANVGAIGVGPALMQLPRNGGAADVVVLLQHDHLQPRLG